MRDDTFFLHQTCMARSPSLRVEVVAWVEPLPRRWPLLERLSPSPLAHRIKCKRQHR